MGFAACIAAGFGVLFALAVAIEAPLSKNADARSVTRTLFNLHTSFQETSTYGT